MLKCVCGASVNLLLLSIIINYSINVLQILCIYDCLDQINRDNVARYVVSLQQPNGSFFGDKWGEVDTRFSFCAVAILSLIVRFL